MANSSAFTDGARPHSAAAKTQPVYSTRDREFLAYAAVIAPLLLLFLWAAFNWYQAISRVVHNYVPLPMEDYWRVVKNLHYYRNFDLRVLWFPHNEHRIVFPEIVFAADMLLARGRQFVPLAASVLCYSGSFVLLAAAILKEKQVSLPVRLSAVLLSAIIIGWQGSALVLSSAFLLQWTLMQMCVVLSLVLLSGVRRNSSNARLAGGIAAGIVATYSSGNGMLVWPVLFAAAWILRSPKRQFAALLCSGIIATGLYFVDYKTPGTLNFANFFTHPLYALEFIGAYLGMPFGGMKGPQFGVRVGLCSIAIATALFAVAIRKGLLGSNTAIVLFGCYTFTLLTAILTAAGRIDTNDPHYSSAEAARYLTLPLVNWAVLASAAIWMAARRQWRVLSPRTIAIAVSVLLLLGLPKLRWWLRANEAVFQDAQFASLSVEAGLTDPLLLTRLFSPDPNFAKAMLPQLRAGRLSIYAKDRTKWLGKPAGSFARILTEPAPGRITYTYPVEGGLEVAGWTDELAQHNGWFLLANEAKQIVGFGRRLPSGYPPVLPPFSSPPSSGWVGFANLAYPSKQIFAYAITPAGLLPMNGAVTIPPIEPVRAEALGEPIPGITWKAQSLRLSSDLPGVKVRGTPPAHIVSSWNENHAAVGELESSDFAVPANRCLIVPAMNGGPAGGISIALVNSETGQTVTAAPMQDGMNWWIDWRFHLNPDVKRVRVLVQDYGKDWGQWVASGQPMSCR